MISLDRFLNIVFPFLKFLNTIKGMSHPCQSHTTRSPTTKQKGGQTPCKKKKNGNPWGTFPDHHSLPGTSSPSFPPASRLPSPGTPPGSCWYTQPRAGASAHPRYLLHQQPGGLILTLLLFLVTGHQLCIQPPTRLLLRWSRGARGELGLFAKARHQLPGCGIFPALLLHPTCIGGEGHLGKLGGHGLLSLLLRAHRTRRRLPLLGGGAGHRGGTGRGGRGQSGGGQRGGSNDSGRG